MPRGGPRPNSGGARPGAGRKAKTTVAYQTTMRQVVLDAVTPDDWRAVALVALGQARDGSKDARDWLSSWVMGKVPDQLEVSGPEGGALRIVIEE